MAITINGSTGISGVDGSAGTPALIGSDADTGIFLAAGQVSASVNGTAGNVPLVSGTAQASTSGTSIDFTGIPSWVKRITVMFNGVSTNGTSNLQVQLGAGSVTTSGYTSGAVSARATVASGPVTTSTTGILSYTDFVAATDLASGFIQILNVSGNNWIVTAVTGNSAGSRTTTGTGTINLSGTLDRIRVTTVNGTDTFDAGTLNILYE